MPKIHSTGRMGNPEDFNVFQKRRASSYYPIVMNIEIATS